MRDITSGQDCEAEYLRENGLWLIPVFQDKRKLRKLLGEQRSPTLSSRRKVPSHPDANAPCTPGQNHFKPVSFASAWRQLDTMETQGPIQRHRILDSRCPTPSSSRPPDANMANTFGQRISFVSRQSFDDDGEQLHVGSANGYSYASPEQPPYHGWKALRSPPLPSTVERDESVSQRHAVSPGCLQPHSSSNVSTDAP